MKKTKNLLDLYMHTCGRSEVPDDFWRWSFVSLMAACAGDKVWVRKLRGSPVKPDLFIFLIGPSALGKGTAIDRVVDMEIKSELGINRFLGDVSAAGLKDHMSEGDGLWLVMDELATDIGSGKQADNFVKLMTKLYTANNPIDSRIRGDGKHTGGHIRIEKPFINWLAGTTWDWLIETITAKSTHGGFGSRIQPIFAHYNLGVRYRRPIYPKDCERVEELIRARLLQIAYGVEGEFKMTEQAEAMEEQWYMNRPSPEEESIIPWWRRGHDLMLKLAMLHSLMLRTDMKIRRGDIYQAIQWYQGLYKCARKLLQLAAETPESAKVERVQAYIQSKGEVKHTLLANAMYKHQIRKRDLAIAVEELVNRSLVSYIKDGYKWEDGENA